MTTALVRRNPRTRAARPDRQPGRLHRGREPHPGAEPRRRVRARQPLPRDEDLDAARQLVLSHLRFVVHIARGYHGYGLPLGDLVQEGNVGLMKAVKRFDPDVGVRLVSFAVHWIRAEIHEYVLRNWRLVKIATTKAQRKLFFNLRKYKKHLGWLQRRGDAGRRARPRRHAPRKSPRWSSGSRRATCPSIPRRTRTTRRVLLAGRVPAGAGCRPGARGRACRVGRRRDRRSRTPWRSSMPAARTSCAPAG